MQPNKVIFCFFKLTMNEFVDLIKSSFNKQILYSIQKWLKVILRLSSKKVLADCRQFFDFVVQMNQFQLRLHLEQLT